MLNRFICNIISYGGGPVLENTILKNPEKNLNTEKLTMKISDYMVAFSGLAKSYCVGIVDMVDSTKISSEMNEISWGKYYEIFLNSMARVLPRFGGVVIKNQGDVFCIIFQNHQNLQNLVL